MSQPITCKEYSIEQLIQIRSQWDELFDNCSIKTAFGSLDWTVLWWKNFSHYFPEGECVLTVVTAWAGDSLIGLIPFTYPQKLFYGMKRLRPLGDIDVREGMTDEPPVLLREGQEDAAFEAIKDYLCRPRAADRWDCSFLPKLEMTTLDTFHARNENEGRKAHSVRQVAKIPATWREFYAGLSRSMKTNLSYYPRKLAKKGKTWTYRIATTQDAIRQELPHLIRLHKARAGSTRGIQHMDHMPTPAHETFLTETMITLAAKEQAWIGIVEIDGQLAAIQSFLITDDTITFYYSGFEIGFYDYSPLLILAAETIKHCIDKGISNLNFLPSWVGSDGRCTESEAWKTRWGALPAGVIVRDELYAPHVRAHAIRSLRLVKNKLKVLRDKDSTRANQQCPPLIDNPQPSG